MFDKAFLADPVDGFHLSIFVKPFDLSKFADRDMRRIVGFDNGGTKKLCLKGIKDIGWEATKLNAIQFMVRR